MEDTDFTMASSDWTMTTDTEDYEPVKEFADVTFAEKFNSATLVAVGAFMLLVGFTRYPKGKKRTCFKLIHYFLVGYAIGWVHSTDSFD